MSDLENFVPVESSEGGATGAEKSKEQSERFSEQYRQAQARLAGMKKDEKKTKKRDKGLAALLAEFLKENTDPQIVNSIVFLLKDEVLPEFILGILSLYYPNIRALLYEQEQEMLMENPRLIMDTRRLTLTVEAKALGQVREFDQNNLPEDVKQAINIWVQDMLFTSFLHPAWLLSKVYSENTVHSVVVQLVTFILDRFLQTHYIQGEFDKKRVFAHFIIQGVLAQTSKYTHSEQVTLSSHV